MGQAFRAAAAAAATATTAAAAYTFHRIADAAPDIAMTVTARTVTAMTVTVGCSTRQGWGCC